MWVELPISLLSLDHRKMTGHLPCVTWRRVWCGPAIFKHQTKLKQDGVQLPNSQLCLGHPPMIKYSSWKCLHPRRQHKPAIADHANTILPKALSGLTQVFNRNDMEGYLMFQNVIFRALASLNQPNTWLLSRISSFSAQVCVAKNSPHQIPARSEAQMSPMNQLSWVRGEGCTQSPGEGAQLSPDQRQLLATQPPSGTSAPFCLQLPMFPGLRCGTTMGRTL